MDSVSKQQNKFTMKAATAIRVGDIIKTKNNKIHKVRMLLAQDDEVTVAILENDNGIEHKVLSGVLNVYDPNHSNKEKELTKCGLTKKNVVDALFILSPNKYTSTATYFIEHGIGSFNDSGTWIWRSKEDLITLPLDFLVSAYNLVNPEHPVMYD